MSDNDSLIVTFEEFCAPWFEGSRKWGKSITSGSSSQEQVDRIQGALRAVYETAFLGAPVTRETGAQADWLLMLLAPGGEGDWEGLALIPESFWNTSAGKGLFRVMVLVYSDEVLVPMRKAAEALGVSEQRIYHLAMLRRIPCFMDYREKHPRKRRRLRVDLLKQHYLDVIQGGGISQ